MSFKANVNSDKKKKEDILFITSEERETCLQNDIYD